jgi:hypothetical protein
MAGVERYTYPPPGPLRVHRVEEVEARSVVDASAESRGSTTEGEEGDHGL